ncbi:hypothetical protein OG239_42410 (plasmid) [Streptomyces sp. NBC_00868]|uniref:hypothetical protein n=1 Tax=Streptomyces sp. NBC_00868 TaxID=2903683 RepID=UPI002F919725|nr:hypothetical protein OG239_42410 [Streptomyces sp. NBC_00868]
MEYPVPISNLGLQFVVPQRPHAIEQWAEVRPLVDGRDLLVDIHPDGTSSCSSRDLLGPVEGWPFAASDEPRRVELSNNDCVTSCCGGIFVTIRRQGDRVLWMSWENTNDNRDPLPADLYFDAAQYDAELDRAGADFSWEGPVDTAARLLAEELVDLTGPGAGAHAVLAITPERTDPARVTVRMGRRDAPWTPEEDLVRELLVTGQEPIQELVQQFVLRFTAQDPGDTFGPR